MILRKKKNVKFAPEEKKCNKNCQLFKNKAKIKTRLSVCQKTNTQLDLVVRRQQLQLAERRKRKGNNVAIMDVNIETFHILQLVRK